MSATSDGLATIWNLDTGEVELTLNVGRPTNRLTRTFTEAECQQYLRLESCT